MNSRRANDDVDIDSLAVGSHEARLRDRLEHISVHLNVLLVQRLQIAVSWRRATASDHELGGYDGVNEALVPFELLSHVRIRKLES